ncbi:hypothetical protein B484DRAFT_186888 [Ochromonadaceae sp. CCMP2298]|nr:hypothetical protein B484DRAFT_186888 [Ochromonadaceae sp. CCMP2298]
MAGTITTSLAGVVGEGLGGSADGGSRADIGDTDRSSSSSCGGGDSDGGVEQVWGLFEQRVLRKHFGWRASRSTQTPTSTGGAGTGTEGVESEACTSDAGSDEGSSADIGSTSTTLGTAGTSADGAGAASGRVKVVDAVEAEGPTDSQAQMLFDEYGGESAGAGRGGVGGGEEEEERVRGDWGVQVFACLRSKEGEVCWSPVE